jgi:hypothetical protein
MRSAMFRNSLGALLALLLLAPVPAFALTFLGGWSFFQSVPGVATIFPPVDGQNAYQLKIGMGNVPPPNITKLSVTATRDFQITNPMELISITHAFGSVLTNGSINVTLSIQKYNVPSDPFNFPAYSFTAMGTQFPSLNFTKNGSLTQGLYRLTITLTYTTCGQATGCGWNNSSPHTFTFLGQ